MTTELYALLVIVLGAQVPISLGYLALDSAASRRRAVRTLKVALGVGPFREAEAYFDIGEVEPAPARLRFAAYIALQFAVSSLLFVPLMVAWATQSSGALGALSAEPCAGFVAGVRAPFAWAGAALTLLTGAMLWRDAYKLLAEPERGSSNARRAAMRAGLSAVALGVIVLGLLDGIGYGALLHDTACVVRNAPSPQNIGHRITAWSNLTPAVLLSVASLLSLAVALVSGAVSLARRSAS